MDAGRIADKRFQSLDVLRGLAISFVVFAHFAPGSVLRAISMKGDYAIGYGGVILFFFLSGFLIDWNLSLGRNAISYATRRAFRILPMYWVSLLTVIAINHSWSGSDILANATFLAPFVHRQPMSGVYWSLYIEVSFYGLAFILSCIGERAIMLIPYLLISLDAVVWAHRGEPSHFLYHLGFCCAGMQFGAWYRGCLKGIWLGAYIALLSVTSGLFSPVSPYIAVIPLIVAGLLWSGLRLEIHSRSLAFLGLVSYSWYLLHATVGRPLRDAIGSTDLVNGSVAVAVTFCLAIVSYFIIEKPTILFGKRMLKHRRILNSVTS